MPAEDGIEYRTSPPIDDAAPNRFFDESWPHHTHRPFGPVLSRSLAYICTFEVGRLIGFVNVAWDGGVHGFLLDTAVAPDHRHRGIGTELVRRAAQAAARAGLEWLHVDYERDLEDFYRACGFQRTNAGVLRVSATLR